MQTEFHNEFTLLKVYAALEKAGIEHERAIDAVFFMEQDGVVFREQKVA